MVWSWLINNLTLCLFLQITRLNKKYILTQVCYTYSSYKTSLRFKWFAQIIKNIKVALYTLRLFQKKSTPAPTDGMLEILAGLGGGVKDPGNPGGRGPG